MERMEITDSRRGERERERERGNFAVSREKGEDRHEHGTTANCETRGCVLYHDVYVSASLCPKLLKWIESDSN